MKGNALQHCLILRDSRQTSPLFPVGWYTSRLVVWRQVALVVGGFFGGEGGGFFFRSNGVAPASAPAEASPVSVRSCRDVIHRYFFFFLTR